MRIHISLLWIPKSILWIHISTLRCATASIHVSHYCGYIYRYKDVPGFNMCKYQDLKCVAFIYLLVEDMKPNRQDSSTLIYEDTYIFVVDT